MREFRHRIDLDNKCNATRLWLSPLQFPPLLLSVSCFALNHRCQNKMTTPILSRINKIKPWKLTSSWATVKLKYVKNVLVASVNTNTASLGTTNERVRAKERESVMVQQVPDWLNSGRTKEDKAVNLRNLTLFLFGLTQVTFQGREKATCTHYPAGSRAAGFFN